MVFHQRDYRQLCILIFLTLVLLVPFTTWAQMVLSAKPVTALSAADSNEQNQKLEKEMQVGAWRAEFLVDEKGQKTTNLRLAANQPYAGKAGKNIVPDLVLSCKQNSTIVYIDMIERLGASEEDTIQVLYSFEHEYSVGGSWPLSGGQRIMMPDPVDFIGKMNGKTLLSFEITPNETPRITAAFSLNNLDDVFSLMNERCYK